MKIYRAFIKYELSVGSEETIDLFTSLEKAKEKAEFANASRKKQARVMVYHKVKGDFIAVGLWILNNEGEWECEQDYESELEHIYGA